MDSSELIYEAKACITYQKDLLEELGPATRNALGSASVCPRAVLGAQHLKGTLPLTPALCDCSRGQW